MRYFKSVRNFIRAAIMDHISNPLSQIEIYMTHERQSYISDIIKNVYLIHTCLLAVKIHNINVEH